MHIIAQYLFGFLLLSLAFGSAAIHTSPSPTSGEAFEEDLSARSEWERVRLCDPTTGRIPAHIRAREIAYAATLPRREDLGHKSNALQSNVFNERGPFNVGGRTRAVAIDVDNTNVLLAGGVSGDIWRSSDGGNSWAKMSAPASLQGITCITQDIRAGKRSTWYASTGEFWGNSAQLNGTGIYKSTDGGLNWNLLSSTGNNTPNSWDNGFEFVWRVVCDHTNTSQDIVYAATTLGAIMRSSDGGTTWKAVLGSFGNSYGYFTDIAISPSGVLYATISQQAAANSTSIIRGMFRSTDGIKWTNITPASMPQKYGRIVIGIAPSDEKQVYFLANTPGSGFKQVDFQGREDWNSLWKYTYNSGDGSGTGGAWEDRSQNIPGFKATLGQFGDYNSQGSYNMYVKVKPDNPNMVFIGGTNQYRSTDGFSTKTNSTWTAGYKPGSNLPFYEVYDNNHPDQHELLFYPNNPNKMLVGCDGGIFRCDDVSTPVIQWTSLNNGYRTTQFYTCAIEQSKPGSTVIIGGLQDNGTLYSQSTNASSPWTAPGLGDGSYCAIADDGLYYMSRQNGRIGRFELDVQGNVQRYARIDPKGVPKDSFLFINSFVLDPTDTKRMYLPTRHSLWRCNNLTLAPWGVWDTVATATEGWEEIAATTTTKTLSAVAASTAPAHRVYYGTQDGFVYRIDDAHQGNPTPRDITSSTFPRNANIECIALNPRNADTAIVVFSNYNIISVFFTGDGGTTWTAIAGNLEENNNGSGSGPSCRWAEMVEVNGRMMYFVGTSVGLFSTAYLNGSQTVWVQEGASSIGNAVVSMMKVRWSDKVMVVATHGNGVFSGIINELPPQPGIPELESPADNTRGITQLNACTWKKAANAANYAIQLSQDASFTTKVTNSSTRVLSYSPGSLEQGKKTYYWRVQSSGAGGISTYSQAWKFVTAIAAPELDFPASGATGIPATVQLRWKGVTGAKEYRVQLSTSFGFSPIVEDKRVSDTTLSISNLQANKRYYWRVLSNDEDGDGLFSNSRSFNTGNISSVISGDEGVQLTIFPNPVADAASISLRLDKQEQIHCQLVNANGDIVQEVFYGFLNVGTHTLRLQAATLASGGYYLRIKTPQGIQSYPLRIVH